MGLALHGCNSNNLRLVRLVIRLKCKCHVSRCKMLNIQGTRRDCKLMIGRISIGERLLDMI